MLFLISWNSSNLCSLEYRSFQPSAIFESLSKNYSTAFLKVTMTCNSEILFLQDTYSTQKLCVSGKNQNMDETLQFNIICLIFSMDVWVMLHNYLFRKSVITVPLSVCFRQCKDSRAKNIKVSCWWPSVRLPYSQTAYCLRVPLVAHLLGTIWFL